jgi:hypothetical protein
MTIEVKPNNKQPHVLIKLNAPRKGEIFINGQKIPGVQAFRVEGSWQAPPTVVLQLVAWTVEFEGDVEVQLEVTVPGGEESGNEEQSGDPA